MDNKRKIFISKPIETTFVLQWHITNKCENRCAHCYIPHFEKENDSPFRLTLEESYRIIDELVELSNELNVYPRINFSGGNPLLREDFWDLLHYANEKDVFIGILGNPFPLTRRNLESLCENNVQRYQVSLEGLERTHDSIRGRGNYRQTLEGIRKLNEFGIWVSVMSTVSRRNYLELPSVAEVAYLSGAKHFDFARIVPIGEGKNLSKEQLEPNEYREFLFRMLKKYEELIKKGAKPSFIGRKDPLWFLIEEEMGISRPFDKEGGIIEGCSIGKNGLCLDVDGSVYSCRRLPITLGNIRDRSLRDFFLFSEKLNEQRESERIKGCCDCDLINVCRGCRAVAYANTKDYFSKDPQCWRKK